MDKPELALDAAQVDNMREHDGNCIEAVAVNCDGTQDADDVGFGEDKTESQ